MISNQFIFSISDIKIIEIIKLLQSSIDKKDRVKFILLLINIIVEINRGYINFKELKHYDQLALVNENYKRSFFKYRCF